MVDNREVLLVEFLLHPTVLPRGTSMNIPRVIRVTPESHVIWIYSPWSNSAFTFTHDVLSPSVIVVK